MPKQNLHGAQVSSLLVDDRSLGPAQRMRPVVLRSQANARHPLIDEAGILAGADVVGLIDPAREDEIVNRAAPTFKPGQQAGSGRLQHFELHGAAGLLLHDDRTRSDGAPADELADLHLHDVAPAQLAVDREIEQRAVAEPALSVELEPNGPNLLRLQGALGADNPAGIPRTAILGSRIVF
jgi:hypothetical protein